MTRQISRHQVIEVLSIQNSLSTGILTKPGSTFLFSVQSACHGRFESGADSKPFSIDFPTHQNMEMCRLGCYEVRSILLTIAGNDDFLDYQDTRDQAGGITSPSILSVWLMNCGFTPRTNKTN